MVSNAAPNHIKRSGISKIVSNRYVDEVEDSFMQGIMEIGMSQYKFMYYHQAKRGGKGKWSDAIGGLPSPRLAKKYILTYFQSEPSENFLNGIGISSYIIMCTEIINLLPRLHNGIAGGILIAIHSFQEDENTIIRGFCTEAASNYYFEKEVDSMVTESAKPNSLLPPLNKSIFADYQIGGNWNDFVENCQDYLIILQEQFSKYNPKSRWSHIGTPEVSDFCEEIADDIYPNIMLSNREWSHIVRLQDNLIKIRGELGTPIIGIPQNRPEYYVAGRYRTSMYRKCLRALWDMFQYDDDIDLKIAGKNQYETLRSFCNTAKNFYTRSGRISAVPTLDIDTSPKKYKIKQNQRFLVEKLLKEAEDRILEEKKVSESIRRNISKYEHRDRPKYDTKRANSTSPSRYKEIIVSPKSTESEIKDSFEKEEFSAFDFGIDIATKELQGLSEN
ncbi:hypothetical protein cand_019150 [Cryptosporidium andersoni]|uniref:Uncharacterized protein n=1 Tax=Cryptosporidium andersoni TaxID=117008 RepID=A0A1J4MDI0_9CRYT|nr:hypothetical protein cand_019150 [Cryptosporidium andersoni]